MTEAPAPIEIMIPGTFTAMEGVTVSFTEADLAAIAAAYDPATNPAPLVVGHPKTDDPAYGWAKRVFVEGGKLYAEAGDIDPSFAEAVSAKRYSRISPRFYNKDQPNNPTPGNFYLKHIGFLGAQAPAIRGIRPVSFEEADGEGCLTFSQNLEMETQDMSKTDDKPNDAPQTVKIGGEDMSFAEAQTALEKREADIAAREKALADKATKDRHDANVSFCESLVTQGRVAPATKDKVVFLLDTLSAAPEEVSFGEGDAAATPAAVMRDLLSQAKPVISFGEIVKRKDDVVDGAGDDPHEIARKAVSFAEDERKAGRVVSASAAVRHVIAGEKA